MSSSRTVSLVTLGCARNEVDSEELAARLTAGGWTLRDEGEDADVVLVNTCGFIQAAKQESINEVIEAAGSGVKVAAVGCLAERYGTELASALTEEDVDAQVLGFDDYADIAARLDDVLAGRKRPAHVARDRRTLLPVSPASRQQAKAERQVDLTDLPDGVAPASGPQVIRRRLAGGVTAPLKIASGCDRRCSFCAIPSFRGAFVSRRPPELLAEARWLADSGVRELLLVSENSTSYGKDLGDLRLLETVLPELAKTEGIARVRVSYLQPAEVRPGLIDVMTSTPGVVPYFDLSFQHASGPVLRRMRRFGDRERFTGLVEQVRQACPSAGRPVQLHRRLPRRDGRRPPRARAVPERGAAGRDRDLRLLGRGRHRGGDVRRRDQARRGRDRPPGRRVRRHRRGGHGPARRRPDRRDGRGPGRGGRSETAATRAAPPTRRRTWTARRHCWPTARWPLATS